MGCLGAPSVPNLSLHLAFSAKLTCEAGCALLPKLITRLIVQVNLGNQHLKYSYHLKEEMIYGTIIWQFLPNNPFSVKNDKMDKNGVRYSELFTQLDICLLLHTICFKNALWLFQIFKIDKNLVSGLPNRSEWWVSESVHYGIRAMGAMTLRISDLCLSFSPHPNISDGNLHLVHHFFCMQIFQINEKGVSWAWSRWKRRGKWK